MNVTVSKSRLIQAILYSVQSRENMVITITSGLSMFFLFLSLTFPLYTIEMLQGGFKYIIPLFSSLYWLLLESSGWIGVLLVILYSGFTGILVTGIIGSIQYNTTTKKNILSILPGILFSGCASCGAGILGLIGAIGITSALPFEGNLLRIFGIVIIVFSLSSLGNPTK